MLWHEGKLHGTHRVPFDVSDRGLLLADGLFETLPVLNRVPFRLDDHLARLLAGAEELGIGVERGHLEEVALAAAEAAPGGHGVLRLTLTRGPGPRGLKPPERATPTILAAVSPWPAGLVGRPLTLAATSIRRNEHSPTSRLKTLAYLDNVLGLREAAGQGADDALFLNTAGRVACTSAGNLFALLDGAWVTPPVADGVRPGITRALVLRLAGEAGRPVREASLRLADLMTADAVFATNSVRLLSEVTAIDGRRVGGRAEGQRANLLDRLRDLAERECGVDPLRV